MAPSAIRPCWQWRLRWGAKYGASDLLGCFRWHALRFTAGYPLLLAIWWRLASRPIHKRHYSLNQGRDEPTVSIVVAMGNESRNALAKMRNCLELDYPAGKLQIIASLDAQQMARMP